MTPNHLPIVIRAGPQAIARIRDWTRAIGESGRMAEAFARWVERPDPGLVQPLG